MSDPVLVMEHVTLDMTTQARRGGGSRKQRLRRLAGESKRVKVELLADLNLSMSPGESIALITRQQRLRAVTVRLATGSLLPDSGSVRREVDAVAMRALPRVLRRRMTVRQNIYLLGGLLGLAPDFITAHLDEVVEIARFKGSIDKYLYTVGKSAGPRIANAVLVLANPGLVAVERSMYAGSASEHTTELLQDLRSNGTAFLLCVEDFAQARSFCDAAFLIEDGVSTELMSVASAIERVRAASDDPLDEEPEEIEEDDDDDY